MITANTLNNFELLSTLEPTLIENLAAVGQERAINAGEWLFHEGESADALYLIVDGKMELKLHLDRTQDTYIALNTLGKGDALGWSCLVEPYAYRLGAIAVKNTQLIKIDAGALREILKEHPDQGYILMQGITQAMATRMSAISEHVPDMSPKLVLSTVFLGLGVATALITILLGFYMINALADGNSQGIPVFLFCLLFPAGFLYLARMLYPEAIQEAA